MRPRIAAGLVGLVVVALLAAGCSGGGAAADARPAVHRGDLPRAGLGGRRTWWATGPTVTVLMGNGVDPHDWSPSAKDIETRRGAPTWWSPTGSTWRRAWRTPSSRRETRGVRGLPGRPTTSRSASESARTSAAGSSRRQQPADDPHIWLDPVRMSQVVGALAPGLAAGELGVDVAARARRPARARLAGLQPRTGDRDRHRRRGSPQAGHRPRLARLLRPSLPLRGGGGHHPRAHLPGGGLASELAP